MRYVPNAAQLKDWDAFTIRSQKISSWDLMERAARAFCDLALDWLKTNRPDISFDFLVLCGIGNNGGDGLAIARMLHDNGFSVKVRFVGNPSDGSPDFLRNRQLLPLPAVEIDDPNALRGERSSVIIDALFGSGLNRPLTGIFARVVEYINTTDAFRIAVDLPSGMMTDAASDGPVVQAHLTITFQTEKLAMLLPTSGSYTGELLTADIGLDNDFWRDRTNGYALSERVDFSTGRKTRKKFSHKGDYGHVLMLAGSHGKMGAAVLAARAALRTGCGWLTAGVPSCGADTLQATVPEAMVWADAEENELSSLPGLEKFSAIAAGPGIGTGPGAAAMLRKLLERADRPLVLDADALNIIAASGGLMAAIPAGSVLTPHPGEFRRLAGEWRDDFHRLRMLQDMASRTASWIILKGAHTAVASPEGRIFFNTTGTPWMATAGSGDVLTGVIVSLMAQGYPIGFAVQAGVFLHGRAGEMAAGKGHPILAGDIINALPQAWIWCFSDKVN